MIDFSNVSIDRIIVHQIGSINAGEDIILSKSEVQITNEETTDILMAYFLKPFKTEEYFKFDFEMNEGNNVVYDSAFQIFSDINDFYIQSANIAKHLYEVSTHPNIKKGELYVVYLRNVNVDGTLTDAIGLFKSENKDTFIKIYNTGGSFGIDHENGINIKRLDKGCIIYNIHPEDGYKISIVDHTNATEAVFWKTNFLGAQPLEDNFFNTKAFLELCKSFGEKELTEENKVDRTQKIDFMDKSIKFFDKNEEFNEDKFKSQVIGNDNAIEAFNRFKEEYLQGNNCQLEDQFVISPNAVQTSKKFFRSVIKLDKNFHIYVHSRPEFIERGFDNQKELRYYKLYFETES